MEKSDGRSEKKRDHVRMTKPGSRRAGMKSQSPPDSVAGSGLDCVRDGRWTDKAIKASKHCEQTARIPL